MLQVTANVHTASVQHVICTAPNIVQKKKREM